MDKKKIMLIVPMLHQGGFERVCVATARLLEPYYEVSIVLFDSKDIAYDIEGLHVIDLRMGVKDSVIGKVLNVAKRSLAVRKLKRKMKIDIAYSFGPTANMVNVFSGKRAKIWTGIRSYMDMGNPKKIRLFCEKSDKVLCCSEKIREEIAKEYHCEKAVTLYNPLDVAQVRKLAGAEEPELPWQNKDHIIVSMGREDDVKGFWHLIKALALVQKKVADAKLMIIGDGDFSEYRQLAKDLGMEESVYFTGVKRNPFPYLNAAKVYALTSYNEGFPNALIEAMALGVPVIATDCMTGPKEILQKEDEVYGVLIPNMSPDKNLNAEDMSEEEERLAAQLERMMTDVEYRRGYEEAAVRRAYDFSNEFYVECIKELVQNA